MILLGATFGERTMAFVDGLCDCGSLFVVLVGAIFELLEFSALRLNPATPLVPFEAV